MISFSVPAPRLSSSFTHLRRTPTGWGVGRCVAAALILAGSANSQVHVDDNSTDPFPDGSTWAKAYHDLAGAIPNLMPFDEVWVGKGTYFAGTAPASTHTLLSTVEYYGGFVGNETALIQRPSPAIGTVLSGDLDVNGRNNPGDSQHVVTIPAGSFDIRLDGFTIRYGHADLAAAVSSGGGILMDGTQVSPITGIFFDEVRLRNNFATNNGGGLFADWVSDFQMKFCVFRKNSAEMFQGGGAYLDRIEEYNIFSTQFVGNRALRGGGGLSLRRSGSSPWVYSCEFKNNNANLGGGLYMDNSNGDGNGTAAARIGNCTFVDNQAFEFTIPGPFPVISPGFGGGVFLANADSSGVRIFNSITWFNTRTQGMLIQGGSSIEGPGSAGGTALLVEYSDIELPAWSVPPPSTPWPGIGNILADPMFVSPSTGDYSLQAGSPCVDEADDPSIPADILDLNENTNIIETTPNDLILGNAREAGGTGTGNGNDGGGVPGSINDMGARERQ